MSLAISALQWSRPSKNGTSVPVARAHTQIFFLLTSEHCPIFKASNSVLSAALYTRFAVQLLPTCVFRPQAWRARVLWPYLTILAKLRSIRSRWRHVPGVPCQITPTGPPFCPTPSPHSPQCAHECSMYVYPSTLRAQALPSTAVEKPRSCMMHPLPPPPPFAFFLANLSQVSRETQ